MPLSADCQKHNAASDRHRLGAVETNDLYDNVIHSAMKCVLSFYLAKEHHKALRRESRALEGESNFLLRESQQLKAWVDEVEGTEGDFGVYGQAPRRLG